MAFVAGYPGALELAMKVAPRMFEGGRSKRHVPSAQNSKKLRDHLVPSPTLLVTTRRQWLRAAQCAGKIRTHGRISAQTGAPSSGAGGLLKQRSPKRENRDAS